MFTVNSGFIGQFKTGDNINYNLQCLKVMYAAQNAASKDDSLLFCKPITVILVSISEALLHDLFFRISNYTSEGMNNVADKAVKRIRKKKLDQFGTYVAVSKKYDLLGAIGTGLYQQLDDLRRIRNRIHIQNTQKDKPLDENYVFTENRQALAERSLEMILKYSSSNYLRPGHTHGYVDDFELPWNEHVK